MGLVLTLYPRDMGSIPAHSTKGSEGCMLATEFQSSVWTVVRIPHKAVGPVAVPKDW